jgi:hypothetical protein
MKISKTVLNRKTQAGDCADQQNFFMFGELFACAVIDLLALMDFQLGVGGMYETAAMPATDAYNSDTG